MRDCSLALGQTAHELEEYGRSGVDASQRRLVPLGVDAQRMADVPRGDYWHARLGLEPAAKVVMFLGRYTPLTGIKLLIRAFDDVAARNPLMHLVSVGNDDGGLASLLRLQDRLDDRPRIHVLGPIHTEERFGGYAGANVFAPTPLHFEETSMATLEALGCGTAVLCTPEAEDSRSMSQKGVGLMVPRTQSAISNGLETLLGSAPSSLKLPPARCAADSTTGRQSQRSW